MGFENVGRVWTTDSFAEYLSTIEKPSWCKAITLHHTAEPNLAMRPKGFLIQHIQNIKDFYKQKGWHAGPHLFADDDELFGMCDLRKQGVHAVSFNRMAIGIEVLGDYDDDAPDSGRGLCCWITAAAGAKSILDWLELPISKETILFHRDDPQTQKSCPGSNITKKWIIDLINNSAGVPPSVHENQKPDIDMDWSMWDYNGGKWCVPIYEFLIAKGVSPKEITKNLKSVGGDFFFGRELLEGAYYVGKNDVIKPDQRTWVPVREVLELL